MLNEVPIFLILQPVVAVILVLAACTPLRRPGRKDGRPSASGPLDRLLADGAKEAQKLDEEQRAA